jgi:predicted dehydrogenase
MDRRDFVRGSAATSGLLLLKSKTAFGYEANSKVRLGLLGCGHRGTAVASSFVKNTDAHLVALADIFPDQLATAKAHFDELNTSAGKPTIDPRLMFRGFDAVHALASSGEVDAIQISTPPWFHVEHLEAVVNAGKHAYCEKPVGVDVSQLRRALEVARKVEGKVSIDVGFQIRSAPPYVELARRVHEGQIGRIASIRAHYDAPTANYPDRPGLSADEARLRHWLWYRNLSGDILLEQNIHIVDVCNWMMGTHPIRAVAKCSRKVIQTPGDISDNYEVIFTYPEDVEMSFTSTQFNAGHFFDAGATFFGDRGSAEAPYSGKLGITGPNAWTWSDKSSSGGPAKFAEDGAFTDNLALADATKDRGFIESITSGKFHNQIPAGVETAKSCIMGRYAARVGHEVTWEDTEKLGTEYALGIDVKQFR